MKKLGYILRIVVDGQSFWYTEEGKPSMVQDDAKIFRSNLSADLQGNEMKKKNEINNYHVHLLTENNK